MVACGLRFGLGSEPSFPPPGKHAKDGDKLETEGGMLGASLTLTVSRKVLSDMPALKPYWGKPTVRNFREGDGNVGIIRSPDRAITLPGCPFVFLRGSPGKQLPRFTDQSRPRRRPRPRPRQRSRKKQSFSYDLEGWCPVTAHRQRAAGLQPSRKERIACPRDRESTAC